MVSLVRAGAFALALLHVTLGSIDPAQAAPTSASAKRVGPAWGESHEVGDDARFEIDARGQVRVTRELRLEVTGGAVRELDVDGVPVSAIIQDDAAFTSEDGLRSPARMSALEARAAGVSAFRVSVVDPRGLRRGIHTLAVSYAFDGIREGLLRPGPATWQFSWTSPPSRDGRDSAKVTLTLPRGDRLPREVVPLSSPGAPVAMAPLFRAARHADYDEAELMRAHVTRGEAVTWSLVLDASAFESTRARRAPEAQTAAPRTDEESLARPVSARDLAFAAALGFGLWVLAFVRRGVRLADAFLGLVLGVGGAVSGTLAHAALAPACWVGMCAFARFREPERARLGWRDAAWAILPLLVALAFVRGLAWSRFGSLALMGALVAALELVLTLLSWWSHPERRLSMLAQVIRRRAARTKTDEKGRVHVTAAWLAGVREVVLERSGADVLLSVSVERHASGLPRALAALRGNLGSRRLQGDLMCVTTVVPRWFSRAYVEGLLSALGERRKEPSVPRQGEERRSGCSSAA